MEDYEDVLITFDKTVFMNTINGLEENYLEFLNLSESFYGWLLTLNKEEFIEVYEAYLFKDGMGLHFVELAHQDIWSLLKSEATKRIAEMRVMIRIVLLIKEGIFSYTPGEIDSEWRVDVTEKGKKVADSLALVSALRFTRQLQDKFKIEQNGSGDDTKTD